MVYLGEGGFENCGGEISGICGNHIGVFLRYFDVSGIDSIEMDYYSDWGNHLFRDYVRNGSCAFACDGGSRT